MRKRIVVGLAVGFGFFSIVVGACSSDPGVNQGPFDGSVEASLSDRRGTVGDPDGLPGPCGDCACFDPAGVISPASTLLPPTANQGKCASDDLITQFLAACAPEHVGAIDAGLDASVGVDAGETCSDFVQTNPDCALCLGGKSPADAGAVAPFPWPALLTTDTKGDVIPNVAACLAAISTGTDTCKSNYAGDDLCLESGCGAGCVSADFSACATAETTDPTSTCLTGYPVDAACVTALNAITEADAVSKCAASTTINTNADFDAVFLTVGRTLCE
jgi:hypothetical protein